jgi:hypothetical protein
MLAGAAAAQSSSSSLSPSQAFESVMSPYRRPEFSLPAGAGVRVFDAGRRESPDVRADDSTKLLQEIKRQREDEAHQNSTWSRPDLVSPQPRKIVCDAGTMCREY